MVLPKKTHKPKLEVVANPRVEKKITPRQEEFCRIYCTQDITQTEAAIRAGYSPQSGHAIASQLLNGRDYPHVLTRIAEIKGELARKYEVTFETHVQKLAEQYRGQAAGLYIDRKEILHGKIDQMSREEVLREIKRLQEEFPGLAAVATGNVIEGEAVDVTKKE